MRSQWIQPAKEKDVHTSRRRIPIIGAIALLVCFPGIARPRELLLVGDGVSRAPIIVFEGAPPYTRQAAEELAAYMEKISGARPKIIEGKPNPVPEHAIWVGFQPKLTELFPTTDFDFQHPEEILIAASESHLVISGRDRWNPDHMVVEGRRHTIHGKQQEYGTANAVYTFLQDYLDVRWLWPGELGEDVVQRKTIAFAPFEFRYHPQVRARSGLLHYSSLGDIGRSEDWTRRQRLQLDSLYLPGGHAYTDWWDRFHEAHPEYFALQPDGTRSGHPNPKNAKLCQSNPAVWDQWLAEVEAQLEKDPNRTVFNALPNDGYTTGICVCENCKAWDRPTGELLPYYWKGHREQYHPMSDRYITFANHLAEKLRERFPDRDYYVKMGAYGNSRPAPAEANPADNVIAPHVSHFPWKEEMREPHKEQWKGWAARGAPKMMYRPNTGSPAGWQQGLPEVLMRKTIEDFRFITEMNYIGVFVDAVWEHWATHGPQYYLMAQLTWNPTADGNAILDDYYRRGFGPASEEIDAYWTLLEEARDEFIAKHGSYTYKERPSGFLQLYTDNLLDRVDDLLNRAAAKVEGKPQRYSARMAFVRDGMAYTRLVVENIEWMEQYWQHKDEKIADKVRANWESMERICQENPMAINWVFVRPQTPRMAGLHPDSPNAKWKIRSRRDVEEGLDQN